MLRRKWTFNEGMLTKGGPLAPSCFWAASSSQHSAKAKTFLLVSIKKLAAVASPENRIKIFSLRLSVENSSILLITEGKSKMEENIVPKVNNWVPGLGYKLTKRKKLSSQLKTHFPCISFSIQQIWAIFDVQPQWKFFDSIFWWSNSC